MKSVRLAWAVAAAAIIAGGVFGTGSAVWAKLENPAIGKVRHVVLYAYKDDVTPEQQAEIAEQSRKLIDQIPLIEDLEWGTDLTEGARSQGYTHCLIFTFATPEAVKEYVARPAHQAFFELAKPHLGKLLVVDYVAQE
ncbi:MAG: Dabb family protein [Candidatus Hydrogenedens sp.]|nr:Dabb family protein [Candidatus Hydrogenedens sp.]